MEKQLQTDKMHIRLFRLTLQFTRALQPLYYKQFHATKESIYDLAMDYYTGFITPKSRVKGNEQTLLDKFDPTITSFEYLVKRCVKTRLIDSSRCNPYIKTEVSIDSFLDEFGDVVLKSFSLTSEEEQLVEDYSYKKLQLMAMRAKFLKLSKRGQLSIKTQFDTVKYGLSEKFVSMFEQVVEDEEELEMTVSVVNGNEVVVCPVQQVTTKTIVALVGDSIREFNRFTGELRSKERLPLAILKEELLGIPTIFKTGVSREEFLRQYKV